MLIQWKGKLYLVKNVLQRKTCQDTRTGQNCRSTMTTLITVWQRTSILVVGTKTKTKITVIRTRKTVLIVMRATATVITITIAVTKENNMNSSNINSKINIKHTSTCIDLTLTNKKNLFKLSNTFETGISDHHKLVSTTLKSGRFKGTPKMKIYWSYKIFEIENFNRIWKDKLKNLTNHSYAEFENVFLKELNKHAPLKKKIV